MSGSALIEFPGNKIGQTETGSYLPGGTGLLDIEGMHVEPPYRTDGSGGETAGHQGYEQNIVAGKGRIVPFYAGKDSRIQQVAYPSDTGVNLIFGKMFVQQPLYD